MNITPKDVQVFLTNVGVKSAVVHHTKEGVKIEGVINSVLKISLYAEVVNNQLHYVIKDKGENILSEGHGEFVKTQLQAIDVCKDIVRILADRMGKNEYNKKQKELNNKVKQGTGSFYYRVNLYLYSLLNEMKVDYKVTMLDSKIVAVIGGKKVIYDFDDNPEVTNLKSGNGRLVAQLGVEDFKYKTLAYLTGKTVTQKELVEEITKTLNVYNIKNKVDGESVLTERGVFTVDHTGLTFTVNGNRGSITKPINSLIPQTIKDALAEIVIMHIFNKERNVKA